MIYCGVASGDDNTCIVVSASATNPNILMVVLVEARRREREVVALAFSGGELSPPYEFFV